MSLNIQFSRPIDRRQETSIDLEVNQPLQSRTSGPPRYPNRMASPIGMHSIRFWVLVRKYPRKSWGNLPDITFPSQSLDSLYSTINSQVGISGCPSIDMTFSMADEDYIFSLPRNNENHFEGMKAFVMHKCRSSQPAQGDEPMALDMYMVP